MSNLEMPPIPTWELNEEEQALYKKAWGPQTHWDLVWEVVAILFLFMGVYLIITLEPLNMVLGLVVAQAVTVHASFSTRDREAAKTAFSLISIIHYLDNDILIKTISEKRGAGK